MSQFPSATSPRTSVSPVGTPPPSRPTTPVSPTGKPSPKTPVSNPSAFQSQSSGLVVVSPGGDSVVDKSPLLSGKSMSSLVERMPLSEHDGLIGEVKTAIHGDVQQAIDKSRTPEELSMALKKINQFHSTKLSELCASDSSLAGIKDQLVQILDKEMARGLSVVDELDSKAPTISLQSSSQISSDELDSGISTQSLVSRMTRFPDPLKIVKLPSLPKPPNISQDDYDPEFDRFVDVPDEFIGGYGLDFSSLFDPSLGETGMTSPGEDGTIGRNAFNPEIQNSFGMRITLEPAIVHLNIALTCAHEDTHATLHDKLPYISVEESDLDQYSSSEQGRITTAQNQMVHASEVVAYTSNIDNLEQWLETNQKTATPTMIEQAHELLAVFETRRDEHLQNLPPNLRPILKGGDVKSVYAAIIKEQGIQEDWLHHPE